MAERTSRRDFLRDGILTGIGAVVPKGKLTSSTETLSEPARHEKWLEDLKKADEILLSQQSILPREYAPRMRTNLDLHSSFYLVNYNDKNGSNEPVVFNGFGKTRISLFEEENGDNCVFVELSKEAMVNMSSMRVDLIRGLGTDNEQGYSHYRGGNWMTESFNDNEYTEDDFPSIPIFIGTNEIMSNYSNYFTVGGSGALNLVDINLYRSGLAIKEVDDNKLDFVLETEMKIVRLDGVSVFLPDLDMPENPKPSPFRDTPIQL